MCLSYRKVPVTPRTFETTKCSAHSHSHPGSLSLLSQAFLIMDGEDIPDFSSLKEETAYWKELSLKYKQR
jgi:hypothetical protein